MDAVTLATLLIGFGFVLLAAELFFPTGGVLFVLAAVMIVGGCLLVFSTGDTTSGFLTLLGVFVGLPMVGLLMFVLWPYSPMGRRVLVASTDATVAALPVNLELEQLRGKFGRAVSDLRPSGVVDFNGRRIDTVTEGRMVLAGAWVKCIDARAGRVLVRPCDPPQVVDLEGVEFEL